MTIVQMPYFEAVCRLENLTKAAEEMNVSQPAMSSMIKKLETECGVPLFVRHKNRLEVTEEGKLLLREVRAVLTQLKQLDHFAGELTRARKHLRIGLSTICGNMVYPSLWAEYTRRFPDVEINSCEEGPGRLFSLLESGALDVVIASSPNYSLPFRQVHLLETQQQFFVQRSNPLTALGRALTLEEIASQPLVLQANNKPFNDWLLGSLEKRGLDYKIVHATEQLYTMAKFIARGMAGGFMLTHTFDDNPEIVGLPYEGGQSLAANMFYREGEALTQPLLDFLKTARELTFI